MVAAGRNERGLPAIALRYLEAQDATIKAESTFQISDLKMHMTNTRARVNRSKATGPHTRRDGRVACPLACRIVGVLPYPEASTFTRGTC
jgi:hypothetical protein